MSLEKENAKLKVENVSLRERNFELQSNLEDLNEKGKCSLCDDDIYNFYHKLANRLQKCNRIGENQRNVMLQKICCKYIFFNLIKNIKKNTYNILNVEI